MNHEPPVAYFITIRCYGAWLHGDDRNSVDRIHNAYKTPFLESNKRREGYEKPAMKHPPFNLDVEARKIVEAEIERTCAHQEWTLIRHRALGDHVHIVVSAPDWEPEKVMGHFKSWFTRRLREYGKARADQTV